MSIDAPKQSGLQSSSPGRKASEDRIIGDFIEIGDASQVTPEELRRAEALLLKISEEDESEDANVR